MVPQDPSVHLGDRLSTSWRELQGKKEFEDRVGVPVRHGAEEFEARTAERNERGEEAVHGRFAAFEEVQDPVEVSG
jgi:hypothetical protein